MTKRTKKEQTEAAQLETKITKARQKRPKKYLNNADLLIEISLSKAQSTPNRWQMTDKLAKMLTLLTSNFSKKNKFANYSYNEDMQAYAMMMLVRTWHKFNEETGKNPFAFYTQCVKNSFIQYLNQEKRQRNIRDEILVKKGLTPSFNYQLEYENSRHVDDEEDHHQIVKTAENLKTEDKADELLGFTKTK